MSPAFIVLGIKIQKGTVSSVPVHSLLSDLAILEPWTGDRIRICCTDQFDLLPFLKLCGSLIRGWAQNARDPNAAPGLELHFRLFDSSRATVELSSDFHHLIFVFIRRF